MRWARPWRCKDEQDRAGPRPWEAYMSVWILTSTQVIYYKTTVSVSIEEAQIGGPWAWAIGDPSQSCFPEETKTEKLVVISRTTNMWEILEVRDDKSEGKLESWLCLPFSSQIVGVSFGSTFPLTLTSWAVSFPWCLEVELLNNILWTEKELWDWKQSRQLHKELLWVESGGRPSEAFTAALHSAKRGTGALKGAKAESRMTTKEKYVHIDRNWGVFLPAVSPQGSTWPLTTCVSKRHSSSFHVRWSL